ncbi:MAG: VCBS repeat-containing protein [Streptomyces sp.]|nr:VCBS repeat-containing protein [Streptomyces sp.]
MSETQPERLPSRRRLVAACTAGILSLGAFALGTSAQAATPGAHHGITQPAAAAGRLPHIDKSAAVAGGRKTAPYSSAAQAATAAPQRYDVDGDGYDDQLFRAGDGNFYDSLATTNELIGAADDQFVDVLTPGDLNGTAGPEVLATTSGGRLEMFTPGNFPGSPSWGGNGWGAYNKLAAVDDLSGDGRADIVARDYSGKLYLYQGTGNATGEPFAARTLIGSGWGVYDQLTSPGDVDGDGISDLVARDTSGTLWLYKGTGSAAAPFAGRTQIGGGWNTYTQLVGLGNNASGVAHLWARTAGGALFVYTPNGTGGFVARQQIDTGFGVDLIAGAGNISYWGKRQLLGETPSGSLFWYQADTEGGFFPRQSASDAGEWAGDFSLTFANALTSSGEPDFLDNYANGLYNVSAGYSLISTGWSGYNLVLGTGDLNGDGKGDILARDGSGRLYLFRGTGDGLHLASRILVGSGWGTYNAIVGAGDFSGDGRADIVARTADGTLYLYKGTGNASAPFAARAQVSTGWKQFVQLASPGDMDGDGRADLLAVDSTGTAYRYSANGTGGFSARVGVGPGWNTYKKLY